jgi:Putative Ig domain
MPVLDFALSNPQATCLRAHAGLIRALTILLTIVSCALFATAAAITESNSGQSLSLWGAVPAGKINQQYKGIFVAGGGVSPYQYTVASGALPPGLTLDSHTGLLTGTPSEPGTFNFAVVVTDKPRPDRGGQMYTIAVAKNSGVSVGLSISPTSATVSSGGTQQFTATVTGTWNTAVTWSASSGSITPSGLYTAPEVQSTTTASVTATSRADSSVSASAAITINPTQNQSLQITTSSLAPGQQGETYSAAFAAVGGTQPYSWGISSGTLPPGITLNTNGDLAGTPTAAGTSAFSVQVTDANNLKATGTFSLAIGAGSGYDGPAQLPIATVQSSMANSPASGSVITISSATNLQVALNAVECGQTIQLEAGATFGGVFNLPAKNCNVNQWVIIRTSSPDSALPPEGQRATPCYAGVASLPGRPAYSCSNPQNVLAKVEQQTAGDGPFKLASGANFYRFIGLEITRAAGIKGSARLISFLGTADHIILDRSWLHGNPQDETSGGIELSGGTNIAVVDSYFSDFHCIAVTGTCTDAHAVSGGVSNTQDGPFLIQNNFLEASGEAVMFGGGPATMTPTDIEILGNHFWKPWQWMPGNPQFVGGADGRPFIVKNHLELKNAARVLVEANLMENSWGGFSQNGFGILMSPKNQHTQSGNNVCPICQVSDVTIRYTKVSHAGGGIQLATELSGNGKDGAPALAGTRWSLHDLVFDDLSVKYVGGGGVFEITNGWPKNPLNTITINHVTAFSDPTSHLMVTGNVAPNQDMYGFVFTNNLVLTGRYPIWNAGGGPRSCAYEDVPVTSITKCFATVTFGNNGLIATPSQFPPSVWPTGNMFPATTDDVGFVNYNNGNGGNYELAPNSPYKNLGTDGKDLGADIVGLNQALANAE